MRLDKPEPVFVPVPKLANGKRKKFNIYADTREECEEKLAVMIAEKNAEIAAEKERLKAEQSA